MDLIEYLPSESAVLSTVFVILFIPIIYLVLSGPSFDEPVEYHVPSPVQCHPDWEGKELDEPFTKAEGPSFEQTNDFG